MIKRNKIIAVVITVSAVVVLSIALLIFNANRIIKYELERRLGKDFSVEKISLGFGGVDALGVKLMKDNEVFLQADRLAVKADFLGFLKKNYSISSIMLERPVLHLKTDRAGKLLIPFGAPADKAGDKRTEADKTDKGSDSGKMPAVEIRQVIVKDGTLFYHDGKISSPPYLIKLEAIGLDLKNISMPPDNRMSAYNLSGNIAGKRSNGSFKCDGNTSFKTFDTDAKVIMSGLDLTAFKPYFQKAGDADISRGTLGLNMNVKIRSENINAPGTARIKDLEFGPAKGIKDRFIGAPRSLVINLLKTNNNEIVVDFLVQGNMKDPRFSISESFVKRMTVLLAEKLGLSSVVEAGKSVVELGAQGVKEAGKGIKSIGEGIQKIFK